jgi:G:T-mismatch repair DNA endonuclease (very short patch repair protein)
LASTPEVPLRHVAQDAQRVLVGEVRFQCGARPQRRTQVETDGMAVLTVWACELKKPDKLTERLNDFLSD